MSVKKKTKIGNQYNQVTHLTMATIWESGKTLHRREPRDQRHPPHTHTPSRRPHDRKKQTRQQNKDEYETQTTPRTYSMARHRKSPCSRRNLMVFDPLTPIPMSPVYPRVKFSVYPCLLLIPFNLICHMTMFRIFLTPSTPSPKPWGMTQGTE